MKQVYLVANAHLDPVWLWRWEEGCAEALSTFRTASELTREFPGFIFNHNESILYQWVKDHDPELFAEIQQQVKEGKWHIIGGWYLQPDCNMPAGESIVRNILSGRKFFAENFNVRPNTAINFDSFGHSRGLVQILRQAGYDSYLVCRPAKNNFDFADQDYLWKGYHGTEIAVHRSDENYNSVWGHAAEELKKFLEEKKEEPVTLVLWGVGDHGGGPSRKDLQYLKEIIETDTAHEICHSFPEAYFAKRQELGAEMPVVERGLNPVADGCYTSQIRVKQKHRELENELYTAEKMASAAELLYEKPYPKAALDEAAKDLLFSEFHDALPGSGTHLVEEDTLRLLDHGLEIVSREKMYTFIALTAGEPRVKDGTSPILFYNPHPFDITGDFSCECGLPKQNWTTNFMSPVVTMGDASDHPGEAVPAQAEKELSNFSLDWRKMVTVHATLKAGSVTRMDVAWEPLPARPAFAPIINDKAFCFDNGEMQVEINTSTGLIDRYAVGGRELVRPGSFRLVTVDDGNNPWGLGSKYSHAERTFQLLTPYEGTEFSGIEDRVIPSVRVIEDGSVRTVVEAVFGLHDSKAAVRYLLPKHGTYFDLEASVFFGEKQQTLKLAIDTALDEADFTGQVMFGREELDKDREIVAQKWLALHDAERAFAAITAGTYGADCRGSLLRLTMLRSAGYTSSDFVMGKAFSEDRYAPRMEQGMREFRFRFDGGSPELLDSLDNEALVFNEKPYALAFCPSGKGKKAAPALLIDNPSVVLSAWKKAEDGRGYILRLYETTGQEQSAVLSFPALSFSQQIRLEGQEVRSWRFIPAERKLEDCPLLEGY